MGKNDLTSLCVHLWVLFLKKNRNKESVLFQKKKKKIPDTSGWGLGLSCETRVVVNSYGRDWSREIVKPNLWRNSAFSDQSPTIQPSLFAPRSSLLAAKSFAKRTLLREARSEERWVTAAEIRKLLSQGFTSTSGCNYLPVIINSAILPLISYSRNRHFAHQNGPVFWIYSIVSASPRFIFFLPLVNFNLVACETKSE